MIFHSVVCLWLKYSKIMYEVWFVCSSLQLAASVTSTVRLDDECYVTGCIISHMVLQSGIHCVQS